MGKYLVIVESPAKAKTINRYLGSEYVVRSSKGHIRDLPTSRTQKKRTSRTNERPEDKEKRRLVEQLGVNPDKQWQANYQILPDKAKVVEELRKLASKAETIFLATDMDREGEAIAWHVREAIGGDPERYYRVVFNEITQKAIRSAFEVPASLDMGKVNAQQTRRFLDRIVGYMLSPLLWKKVARGLSAGRVQSVAVRLIVEREREIRAFIPEEYWDLFAHLTPEITKTAEAAAKTAAEAAPKAESLKWQVAQHLGKKFRPTDEATTQAAVSDLEQRSFAITERELKATKTSPRPPFITSTLQQAASIRLGFSVKRTMTVAQKLYEAGAITYMRTDSTHLSNDAVNAARDFIKLNYGDSYLPDKARFYKSKSQAQEAHEAIRPSNVNVQPKALSSTDRSMVSLYDLIWRQFVACQMPNALYDSTSLAIMAGDYKLRIRGRVQRFDGHIRVNPSTSKNEEDRSLPDLQKGDVLQLNSLEPLQHFTKPSARYSEAALVKELEARGIGRPSTYASIISTIQDRGYASLQKKRFYAEKIGELVTDRLVESFEHLMDYGFTASLEAQLDEISVGSREWLATLDEFYADFLDKLKTAKQAEGGMIPNVPVRTDIDCPKCGRKLVVRTGSTGVFLGCEGYSLKPDEKCTQTLNLAPDDAIIDAEADEEGESRLLRSKHRCSQCQTAMSSYLIDDKRKLHLCGNNPDCSGFEVEFGDFKVAGHTDVALICDKCTAGMTLESGRFGKYFKCTNSECTNTRKLMRNGQAAPPKMTPIDMPELSCKKVDDHYVLRDGLAGLFLAAKKFPKNRETRAALVAELLPHQNEISPKYAHLLRAPTKDAKNNLAIIKFSRKNTEHYVMSESGGKPTGWEAHYRDGSWHEQTGKPKRPTRRKKAKNASRA